MSPYVKKKLKTLTTVKFIRYLDKLERSLVRSLVRTDWLKTKPLQSTINQLYQIRTDKERIQATGFTPKDVEKYYG